MFKVRYSRLWSFGNYENEKVELEQEFSDEVPYSEALSFLMEKVEKDHEKRAEMREVIQRIDDLKINLQYYENEDAFIAGNVRDTSEKKGALILEMKKKLASENRRLRKLFKELMV
jgi:nitrate reductase beta subunit